MKNREEKTGQCRSGGYLMAVTSIVLMLSSTTTSATGTDKVQAIPDYGSNDCVSFKQGEDTNPLNFTFGYACVSANHCEVSAHGCIDESCQYTDYSKGARTALTNISMASRIDTISMGAIGKDLNSTAQWCLVQDGAGNFWALDKQRGNSESFNLQNRHETVVPCKTSDYFRSDIGCVAGTSLK